MIKVYDQTMKLVAYLQNAFNVSYETPFNGLWHASFSLPAGDSKNEECQGLRYVELFDGEERIDLFRIIPYTATRSEDGTTISYECEHVLATLLDDLLFQFHTIGNLGVYTFDVLQYVLSKQTTTRWQLGYTTFNHQYEYTWENESLLGALLSIPKPFAEEYEWKWDTTVYPWKINLVTPSSAVQAYIRYGVNMIGITKETDPTAICTRIYPLGYGEGVNQLTIAEVNGGVPYIDADTIGTYGIIAKTYVDRRFTNADTLKAQAQTILDNLKRPRVSYTVQAAELHRITRNPIDLFKVGSMVRVQDAELGEDVVVRVVNKRKGDVYGAPGNIELEIANKPVDVADEISSLQKRQHIAEVYAQGATNWDTQPFADNADPSHPATLRFWIPQEAVRINKVRLSYESQRFRGYTQAIEGGGAAAITSGPSSLTTTGPSSTVTTSQVGVNNNTDTGIGFIAFDTNFNTSGTMEQAPNHNHGIAPGTRLALEGGGGVTWTASGAHEHKVGYHTHYFTSDPHAHGMDHTHQMPHDHVVELPNHTHGIQFGIYEGPIPTAMGLLVDGELVPGSAISANDVDLLPYLSKDDEGKIRRGQWHEIELVPNGLGRVVASVVIQLFVQSRGGGDY
ncbi:phage tail spike protein [Cohnella sp.]|uniref:phage tail spike protein n=1 Tax=Cohnella sp. TaxID=1883426 RepID=UPI00356B1EBC